MDQLSVRTMEQAPPWPVHFSPEAWFRYYLTQMSYIPIVQEPHVILYL
jgi:hypothetical protein